MLTILQLIVETAVSVDPLLSIEGEKEIDFKKKESESGLNFFDRSPLSFALLFITPTFDIPGASARQVAV